VSALLLLDALAEARIEEAMREGTFDDLPGAVRWSGLRSSKRGISRPTSRRNPALGQFLSCRSISDRRLQP
jgi:hypothetical protein